MKILGRTSKEETNQITALEGHNSMGNLAVIVLFFLLTSVFLLESPLHPWIRGQSGTDSSVFRTIAMMMKHGYMPYRDSFDHKGPLLYIINFIGLCISETWGIWVIEFINLFSTFILLYITASIWTSKKIQTIISVLAGLSMLFEYFETGNLVEEYSMPFITVGLFIFCDYLVNNRYSRFRLVICGFCLGCVFLLRVNMVVVWVVFCIAIFIRTIILKKYNELLSFAIWFTIGLVLAILPILVWLGVNGSLNSFWHAYFKFNFLYSSAKGGRALPSAKWYSFFSFSNTFMFTLSLSIEVFLFFKMRRVEYALLAASLLSSVFMMTISGKDYGHYGMILIPLFVIAIASLCSYLNTDKNIGEIASTLTIGFLICYLIAGKWETELQRAASIYDDKNNRHISTTVMQICETIENWTSENEKISVYGNDNTPYIESKRLHATRYSYQFPIGTVEPQILDEYWEQMQDEKPSIFVITSGLYNDSKVSRFIEENNYYCVWSSNEGSMNDSYSVWWRIESLEGEGTLLDLTDESCAEFSHAELSENQHEGTLGVICHGRLNRNYAEGTLSDYLRDGDYIGLKYTIEDASDLKLLSFYGKKIEDDGQPSVYIYDKDGNMVRECTDYYKEIDESWKRYFINLAGLEGKVTIVFNGGYTDDTGSDNSGYVFSDIRLYETA